PTRSEWDTFRTAVTRIPDLVERAKEFEARYFQSKGVDEVYESQEFVGSNPDGAPVRLAVVPNFSYERVQMTLASCEDKYASGRERTDVEWLFGSPPNKEKNGWRFDALKTMYENPERSHAVSTFDYKET